MSAMISRCPAVRSSGRAALSATQADRASFMMKCASACRRKAQALSSADPRRGMSTRSAATPSRAWAGVAVSGSMARLMLSSVTLARAAALDSVLPVAVEAVLDELLPA